MMKLSTLCYIERGGCYLMLHRVKKQHDVNEGKWIGVGGKLETDESPDECIAREVMEETGLTLVHPRMRGLLTFISPGWDSEYIFLYTAQAQGELTQDCNEGDLRWVPLSDVPQLNLWQGDRIFLDLLLKTDEFFSLKFIYDGDNMVYCALNGEDITTKALGETK